VELRDAIEIEHVDVGGLPTASTPRSFKPHARTVGRHALNALSGCDLFILIQYLSVNVAQSDR